MEILIHQVLLVILDTETNTRVPSEATEDFSDQEKNFLITKIKKARAMDQRRSRLTSEGKNNGLFKMYQPQQLQPLADSLSQQIFDWKMQLGLHEMSDCFFVNCRIDEVETLFILDTSLKTQFTHHTKIEEGHSLNQLVPYRGILCEGIGKEDRFVFWDWRNNTISIKENKVDYNEKSVALFADILFDLTMPPTQQEVVQIMEKSVRELSNKYELDLKKTLPQLKSAISACDFLEPEVVAKTVFEASPIVGEEFRISVADAGVKEAVAVDQKRLPKKDRTMKFVTEAGIEIIIPATYLKRKDKVEIINNPDGTTSIEIKNIEKLKNR